MPTRKVYLVFDPIDPHSRVPMRIQQVAGFSHAQLVVITRGGVRDGPGKVYDIWKDGKNDVGFGDARGNPISWMGLRPGQTYERVGETTFTNAQIANAADRVIHNMGGYDLLFRNCHHFVARLTREISVTCQYPGDRNYHGMTQTGGLEWI